VNGGCITWYSSVGGFNEREKFVSINPVGVTLLANQLQESWVSDRVSCLLQLAFSSVSEHRRFVSRTILIALHVGVLLACFAIDYRVLFEPLTEEIVQDGFQYYKTFYNAPPGIKVRSLSQTHSELKLGTRVHA
jgi:hypothetical protein